MCTPWTFTAGRAWKRYFLGKDNGCNSTLDIWHELVIYDSPLATMMYFYHICIYSTVKCRAGNSLNLFLSESLVFLQKMSESEICSKKRAILSLAHFWWATWVICSWLLIFGEQPKWITHGCSFLVSDLSNLLTLLNYGEWSERFAHIAN